MQGRQAGQWAANGNNKKQIKMPGNNFCQSLSHSPLRATCNKNANYLRKYNVRSAKGLSGDGREEGRGLSCKSCQHPGNAASYYAGHKIANHAICAHFDCELRVQSAQTV